MLASFCICSQHVSAHALLKYLDWITTNYVVTAKGFPELQCLQFFCFFSFSLCDTGLHFVIKSMCLSETSKDTLDLEWILDQIRAASHNTHQPIQRLLLCLVNVYRSIVNSPYMSHRYSAQCTLVLVGGFTHITSHNPLISFLLLKICLSSRPHQRR